MFGVLRHKAGRGAGCFSFGAVLQGMAMCAYSEAEIVFIDELC